VRRPRGQDGSYGQVIPPYDTLVLDEAHLIEDVATQYFGVHVSSFRVEELARDVERELKAAGLDARDRAGEVRRAACAATVSSGSSRAPGRPARPGWMSARVAEESLGLLQRLEGLQTALLACPTAGGLAGLAAGALQLAARWPSSCGPRPTTTSTSWRRAAAASSSGDADRRLGAAQGLLFDEVRAAVLTRPPSRSTAASRT